MALFVKALRQAEWGSRRLVATAQLDRRLISFYGYGRAAARLAAVLKGRYVPV